MNYSSYKRYKESGIDWLSEVPEGWSYNRLANLVDIRSSNVDKKTEENELPVKLCNYVDVYYNQKIDSKIDFMVATARQNEIDRFRLYKGDVVITKDSETPDDIGVPAIVSEKVDDLICGYHLAILRSKPDAICGEYLFYAIESLPSSAQFEVFSNGITRFGLTYNGIKNVIISLPSLLEQKAIAIFLDKKTAEIDTLIAKKEELLKLLAEQRTAIITHAVTKGLDPNAPMKNSGIDWLGKVSALWNSKRLKFTVRLINQKVEANEIDRLYIGLEHIESWTGKRIWDEEAKAEGIVNIFEENDVLFGKLRPYLAKVYHAQEPGICSTEALVLRASEEIEPRFLYYYVLSEAFVNIVDSSTYGAKMPRASWDYIGNLTMLIPTRSEQQFITSYLDKKIAEIDKIKAKAADAISYLKEYRIALITNAVTGKIKVV